MEEVGAKSNTERDLWEIMMNKNENDDVNLSVNERYKGRQKRGKMINKEQKLKYHLGVFCHFRTC